MTDWTPRMIDKLERGVKAGKTYRQIAREIGTSKNACISKAHRIGIHPASGPAVYVIGHDGEGICYSKDPMRAVAIALDMLPTDYGRQEIEAMMRRVPVAELGRWRFE